MTKFLRVFLVLTTIKKHRKGAFWYRKIKVIRRSLYLAVIRDNMCSVSPSLIFLSVILFENQNYPLSTCLDELKFYRWLRFLGYF